MKWFFLFFLPVLSFSLEISVEQSISDEKISSRLESIIQTTNWIIDPRVHSKNGVVFLDGKTKHSQHKNWAEDLAQHTEGVVAVVNNIDVIDLSIWDTSTVLIELQSLGKKIQSKIPAIVLGGIILGLSWLMARGVYKFFLLLFRDRKYSFLMREILARGVTLFIFLLGVYLIFEMLEMTTFAFTIVSGTGLIGLILGIAFRDITENFLASILLSIQNPFREGDLIDLTTSVSGYVATGFVERLTLRATVLRTFDGVQLQIPNATVYKGNIKNYTLSPKRREEIVINLPAGFSLKKAEELVLNIVQGEEGILAQPNPLITVENLTKDSFNLHIYYWVDVHKNDLLKVKSSLTSSIHYVLRSENWL